MSTVGPLLRGVYQRDQSKINRIVISEQSCQNKNCEQSSVYKKKKFLVAD